MRPWWKSRSRAQARHRSKNTISARLFEIEDRLAPNSLLGLGSGLLAAPDSSALVGDLGPAPALVSSGPSAGLFAASAGTVAWSNPSPADSSADTTGRRDAVADARPDSAWRATAHVEADPSLFGPLDAQLGGATATPARTLADPTSEPSHPPAASFSTPAAPGGGGASAATGGAVGASVGAQPVIPGAALAPAAGNAGARPAFSPYNLAPSSAQFDSSGAVGSPTTRTISPLTTGPGDPGATGPLAVTSQEYDFGNAAYVPPDFATLSGARAVELTASVHAPTDLSGGPYPLVVLMHGNHYSEYNGGSAGYNWPLDPGYTSLPNYRGYDYLANVLASHGYIVVSVSTNGVNYLGNFRGDAGMLARAQLIQQHLDIWNALNTTDGTVPASLTGGTAQAPFGTRFVGHVNLQDVGLMGHSRGGEGVVRSYLYNQSLGSPYGIKAVFSLAPVDFTNPTINNVPYAVLLPYNDGDVSDLQGIHFYDDSRYNVPGDTGDKYSILVMGANHNFYNTVWSPGGGYPGASDEGTSPPPTRLTQDQERGTGLAYMSAFFRTYLGGEAQFKPILTGDSTPPPSSLVTPDVIHIGYLPRDSSATRRDINRESSSAALTTNTLGGAVSQSGLTTYSITTSATGEPDRNLSQLNVAYSGTTAAYYENDLPAGSRDERGYNDIQFRIGVAYSNPSGMAQDFSVALTDGAGMTRSTLVSAHSNDLYYPPGTRHEVLNTVRIPLSAFTGLDLSDIRTLRFNFDQRTSGAFQIVDLAFADPANAAGPYVISSTPSGGTFGAQSSVRVQFDRAIDISTFTTASIDSFTRTAGGMVTDLSSAIASVTPVTGSGNTQFDIAFAAQATPGTYALTIGPNIKDLAGHPMDQNHNLVAGEVPDDEYTAIFSIQGPKVLSSTPTGTDSLPGAVSSATITFNEAMDPTTVNSSTVFVYAPDSTSVVSVTPVSGSGNKVFTATFSAPLTAVGYYTLLVSPSVQDAAGNYLDQNGNGVGGEIPADFYVASFAVSGPKVAATSLTATVQPGLGSATVTFNEAMDPASFTPAKAQLYSSNGLIPISSVTPVSGSGNKVFTLAFAPALTATGHYLLQIGPDVRDPYGNPMDQNGNFVTGENPNDAYFAAFDILGPKVTAAAVNSTAPGQADSVRFTFSRSMDPASFQLSDVLSFSGPNGDITAVAFVPVSGSNYTQFDVLFAPQTKSGTYTLALSPAVTDFYGNAIDQNGNFVGGEVPDDVYTTSFTLSGPHVLSGVPSGPAGSFNQVLLTFDTPVDPGSLDPSQVTLTSSGTPVAITGFSVVPYTNNTQVLVSFGAVPTGGSYLLTVGRSAVTDVYGNQPAAAFTLSFGQHGYVATAATYSFTDLSLSGSGATALVFQSGSTYADDDYGTIDLGAQHFSFYGRSYNQVYVNSNGGITFGSGITGYPIGDLSTGNPSQASIAPYWSDWIKTAADGATPMILYKLVGSQLVIQWTDIHHYETGGESPSGVTFQAVLDLSNSNITFNYVSLDDGVAGDRDGLNQTVGTKDADVGFVGRTVVTHNAANPLIGDHKSIRLTYS